MDTMACLLGVRINRIPLYVCLSVKGAWGGGEGVQKNFFRPLGPKFGPKIRGRAGQPGPSPGSATAILTLNS